jgi:uncharacterized protein VirK/YbjX
MNFDRYQMDFSKSYNKYKDEKHSPLIRIFKIVRDTPLFLKMIGVLLKPEVRIVFQRNWRAALIPLRHNYLKLGFPRKDRIALMTHHYNYIRQNLKKDCLNKICREKISLWEENSSEFNCKIVLSILPTIKENTEGNLSLIFKANQIDIFTLSFTICPGGIFGLSSDVMYIGRIQGVRDRMDLIKASAKHCRGIAPQNILIAISEGICLALNIHSIVCPSSRAQLSVARHDELPEELAIYDAFWLDNGATRLYEDIFYIPVPVPHKPTNKIKRSHRSRANNRRKHRETIANIAKNNFHTLFIKKNHKKYCSSTQKWL